MCSTTHCNPNNTQTVNLEFMAFRAAVNAAVNVCKIGFTQLF